MTASKLIMNMMLDNWTRALVRMAYIANPDNMEDAQCSLEDSGWADVQPTTPMDDMFHLVYVQPTNVTFVYDMEAACAK